MAVDSSVALVVPNDGDRKIHSERPPTGPLSTLPKEHPDSFFSYSSEKDYMVVKDNRYVTVRQERTLKSFCRDVLPSESRKKQHNYYFDLIEGFFSTDPTKFREATRAMNLRDFCDLCSFNSYHLFKGVDLLKKFIEATFFEKNNRGAASAADSKSLNEDRHSQLVAFFEGANYEALMGAPSSQQVIHEAIRMLIPVLKTIRPTPSFVLKYVREYIVKKYTDIPACLFEPWGGLSEARKFCDYETYGLSRDGKEAWEGRWAGPDSKIFKASEKMNGDKKALRDIILARKKEITDALTSKVSEVINKSIKLLERGIPDATHDDIALYLFKQSLDWHRIVEELSAIVSFKSESIKKLVETLTETIFNAKKESKTEPELRKAAEKVIKTHIPKIMSEWRYPIPAVPDYAQLDELYRAVSFLESCTRDGSDVDLILLLMTEVALSNSEEEQRLKTLIAKSIQCDKVVVQKIQGYDTYNDCGLLSDSSLQHVLDSQAYVLKLSNGRELRWLPSLKAYIRWGYLPSNEFLNNFLQFSKDFQSRFRQVAMEISQLLTIHVERTPGPYALPLTFSIDGAAAVAAAPLPTSAAAGPDAMVSPLVAALCNTSSGPEFC